MPSPTTAIRAAYAAAGGAARWAPSARWAGAPVRRRPLDTDLVGLVDRLTRRLRTARRVCRTVTLRLRFDDFSRATRSHTMPYATAETSAILATARGLVAAAMPMIEARDHPGGRGPRHLGDGHAIQLALPFERVRRSALDAALDDIRDRYGSDALTRAVLLGRDQAVAAPLLRD
jgi:DNA polymerase-4